MSTQGIKIIGTVTAVLLTVFSLLGVAFSFGVYVTSLHYKVDSSNQEASETKKLAQTNAQILQRMEKEDEIGALIDESRKRYELKGYEDFWLTRPSEN
ncbi:hypothetical protein [Rubellicoccus peritrichatus]|uniref:Septum formation initiator n=1 Tax=Rubellicoccus peritrichatus TaxID=3080537 RepID=A0AAQ3LAM9_9BACT|nr:hypothetical protein [Puniceicoccus sp. CR14]WOO40367.1 hypothetical protein RZN69_17245 [Puniceicoccus sp. CR14]WOO40416.1 hypothetical protein RZN69_17490 [Puniceicoccus sp. CR14]WOO40465.1 hypothetical protein RZN69_17735 [Puniceicoccus sp. CR14]WOO40514.1 hypothetical protein RZN69_17980 [Puniceicoccus sp. CR14]